MMISAAACVRTWREFHFDRAALVLNLFRFGYLSLPIMAITALFAGVIMVIQASPYVERYGAHGFIGWASGFITLREVGPLLAALMFSGRVGTNNAAQIATMGQTDQLDTLRALGIEPHQYLMVPRIAAMALALFALCALSDLIALMGGALTAKVALGTDIRIYFHGLSELVRVSDLYVGLAKSLLFGFAIGFVSCHYGLNARRSAEGVGEAVRASVVAGTISIFVIDYLLA